MKIVNPDYTVEKIVQRMKEAAAAGAPRYDSPWDNSPTPQIAHDGRSLSTFASDLDIRPITLQPQFQPNPDDHYDVSELLQFSDRQFVQNAFLAILKRPADSEGYGGFIESLRSGELNKIDVLARLRYSAEGREKGVRIDGLRFNATVRKFYRIPVVGYFINLFVAIARLPGMIRGQRQFEAHILAQQEILLNQINHLGRQLLKHAENMAAENAANRESLQQQFAELAAQREEELWALGKQLGQMTAEWKQEFENLLDTHRRETDRVDLLSQRLADLSSELERASERNQRVTSDFVLQAQQFSRFLQQAGERLPSSSDQAARQAIEAEQAHLLDGFYASFDDQFRGRREEIKERLRVYLPFVANKTDGPVIDVGCGRGEWLELLAEAGLQGLGVESNKVLIEQCRTRGLEVVEADLTNYLRGLPEQSVAAVTGFHIVEHLPIETLVDFLNETMRVLRSGGVIILETPNPRNVLVGTCNFYFDPTHRNPIPSEVLHFLLESRGFSRIHVMLLNPSDEMPVAGDSEVVERFNRYFYGPMDYGVVAIKLDAEQNGQ